MPGMVERLPDATGAVRDLPVFGSESPMRKVTESVAFDHAWDRTRRDQVRELFDSMAAGWSESHDSPERTAALADGLARGGVNGTVVVELGAGSGLGTREIVSHFPGVIAVDLSMAMLSAAPPLAAMVCADGAELPFPDQSIDLLILVNMLLFPTEIARVLVADGGLLWVNTMGEETPIHLSSADVVAALPGQWRGVESRAGTGTWLAIHRDPETASPA